MRIDFISAVPEILDSPLKVSIIKNAIDKKIVEINIHNLHDYATDKFKHIDDYQYGGSAGMVIKCQPVFDCIESLQKQRNYDEIIYVTADGELLNQTIANDLSLKENIIILAGHYKGIDQRIRDSLITLEISIGDYVLSGGELPALVLIDAIVRLIPGVLGDAQSALTDSFQDGLLEPPIYTRPEDFRGMKVPQVLLSGNHKEIKEWRIEQAIMKTKKKKPDLLK